jgi:GH15 family glucan-1,4-alpha-glucosidase
MISKCLFRDFALAVLQLPLRVNVIHNWSGAASTQGSLIHLDVRSHECHGPSISDYGAIGDCRSLALVSRQGSIDWLCWPRFDSSSIFGRILDNEKGGFWSITPSQPCRLSRSYVRDSNVLQTHFACSGGAATLTDFMVVFPEKLKGKSLVADHELVRRLVCTEGKIEIEINFCPRSSYGAEPLEIRDRGKLGLRMDIEPGALWLRSNVSLAIGKEVAHASIVMQAGDVLEFSLSYSEQAPAVLPCLGERLERAIDLSIKWWQQWAAKGNYHGPFREAVVRSALILKLLAYSPSGAVLAAPTTSLPERIGDALNWDYRYCWLRDASLTVRALLGLGYIEEAEGFLTWLLHSTRLTQPELEILYTVFGQRAPREIALGHLSGHCKSHPVRVGNDARNQLQLDVYGEVIDASAQYLEHGGQFSRSTQKVLVGFGKFVAKNWDQPDEGIWEPRTGRQNNTHSRLLCWTALDQLLKLAEKGLLGGVPRESFTRERERIRDQIQRRAWNHRLASYVSVLDGDSLDATLLRIPWYGFEPASSASMKSTYTKVRERLGSRDGLLHRYERNPPEGAFGICGFWEVEYLALGGGTLTDAEKLFSSLLRFSNDLGLFAEEIDPESGDALGNFPQAFTHVGLISAALTLDEKSRGETPAERTRQHVKRAARARI